MKLSVLETKVRDFGMLKNHWGSSNRQKKVAKFGLKFVGPFKLLEVVNNKFLIDVEVERTTVNLNQVRLYKFRNDNEHSAPKFHDLVSLLVFLHFRLIAYLMTIFFLQNILV